MFLNKKSEALSIEIIGHRPEVLLRIGRIHKYNSICSK